MTTYIEIGRIGGFQSPFPADTGNVVRCEAGRVLETAFLALVSQNATHSFQPQAFRRRMTAGLRGMTGFGRLPSLIRRLQGRFECPLLRCKAAVRLRSNQTLSVRSGADCPSLLPSFSELLAKCALKDRSITLRERLLKRPSGLTRPRPVGQFLSGGPPRPEGSDAHLTTRSRPNRVALWPKEDPICPSQSRATALPLHSRFYPEPPYQYVGACCLIGVWKADRSVLEDLLPAPLVLTPESQVIATVCDYPHLTGLGSYHASALFIRCRFDGTFSMNVIRAAAGLRAPSTGKTSSTSSSSLHRRRARHPRFMS